MKNRVYLLGPAILAIVAASFLAAPGCGSDTCQGASSKICEKACACGSKCSVNGVNFDSKASCSLALGAQCDPTKHDVDWAACSTALDTAQCQGGNQGTGGGSSSSSSSTSATSSASGSGSGGGSSSSGGSSDGVLMVPQECSAPVSGAGGGDAGTD